MHVEWMQFAAPLPTTLYNSRVATDSAGNIYVLDLPPAKPSLTKYDSEGRILWTRDVVLTGTEESIATLEIDPSGYVYLAGWTRGALDCQVNRGGKDIFVIKYDWNGSQVWTRQFGSAADDSIRSAATDRFGNLWLYGLTAGDLAETGSAGTNSILLVKYDSQGEQQWIRQTAAGIVGGAGDIAVDRQGNAYLAGVTGIYLTREGKFPALEGEVSAGVSDVYIMKYDSAGQRIWADQFGLSGYDMASGVTTDASGNAYLLYTLHKPGAQRDAYLVKYDAQGEAQWRHAIAPFQKAGVQAIAIDKRGDIYVAGNHPPASGWYRGAAAGPAPWLLKLDADGEQRWLYDFASERDDQLTGFALDTRGNAYLAGHRFAIVGADYRMERWLMKLR